MHNNFHAIILSAGMSSRMGTPKALLNWHGQKLIEYNLDNLITNGITNINLVLGHEKEKILPYVQRKEVNIIFNNNYKQGKSSSILEGLKNIKNEAENIILKSVDQPRPIWFLRKIITEHLEKKSIITAPISEGKRGHPIILNKKVFNQILNINNYKNGLKDIFRENNDLVSTVKMKNKWTHLDLNTKSIYEEALLYPLEKNE